MVSSSTVRTIAICMAIMLCGVVYRHGGSSSDKAALVSLPVGGIDEELGVLNEKLVALEAAKKQRTIRNPQQEASADQVEVPKGAGNEPELPAVPTSDAPLIKKSVKKASSSEGSAFAAAPRTPLDDKMDAIFTTELRKQVESDFDQGLRKHDEPHVPMCYSIARDVLDVQLPPGVGGNPKNMSQKYDPEDPYPDIGMCPLTRRIVCEEGGGSQHSEKTKGKGLVLVKLHGFDVDDQPAEAGNVDFFNQFGLLPENYPTQLFDSVDFVFWRYSHSRVDDALGNESATQSTKGVALCTEVGNVRYVWVSDTAECKSCGVAKVLTYLGFPSSVPTENPHLLFSPESLEIWPYRSITMVETNMRGPFLNEWSRGGAGSTADRPGEPSSSTTAARARPSGRYSAWVDVLAFAGRPRRPLYIEDELAALVAVSKSENGKAGTSLAEKLPQHLKMAFFNDVDASTVSQELFLHMQVSVLTLPRSLHKAYFHHLASDVCPAAIGDCLRKNDAALSKALLKGPGALPGSIYYRHQRWRQYANTDVANKLREIGADAENPIRRHSDPCSNIFVVYDSHAIDLLPKTTRRSVSFLTAIMTSEFGPSLPLQDRRDILAGTARCGWYVRPHAPGHRSQPNPAHARVMNIGKPAGGAPPRAPVGRPGKRR